MRKPGSRTAYRLGLGFATALLSFIPAVDAQQDLDERPRREVGVVVEEVTPESLGDRAGLQTGDFLLSWCRVTGSPSGPCLAEGRLESPFDWLEMDFEQAPRGGVRVIGRRAGASTTWALLPGSQSVEVRPVLPEPLLSLYQEGRSLAASQPESAAERWRSAAVQVRQAGDDRLGVWFLSRGAGTLAEARQWPQADLLYDEAANQARSLRESAIETQILKAWGQTFQSRSDWERAEDLYRRSLELDRPAGRELAVAWTLGNLGTVKAQRRNTQGADILAWQALEILEKLAPRSSSLAASLRNLGSVTQLRGDLASSELHLEHALTIMENLAAGSLETAHTLIHLGHIKMGRGNLAGAEELLRRAMAIYERIRPESLDMATALYSLGRTAVDRGDQETADYFLRSALAIQERLDASGGTVASTLQSLGLQALERKDLNKAEEYLRRAVSLYEKLAEGSALAKALQNLGVIVARKGDCGAAESHFQRALDIRQELEPDSIHVAASLRSFGFLGHVCGDLPKAETYYKRALTLYEKLDPGGVVHAMVLHDLGLVHQGQGRPISAVEYLCRATAHFDAYREKSGREFHRTDCLLAQVEIGREREAFHVLERGRARAFLEQLAERDLLFSSDLPDEIDRRRKQLAHEIESTQGALAQLGTTENSAEAERLVKDLMKARYEQRELTAQTLRSSPRFAALQYPESLDLAGARRALDPGTVLLSYAVGEEKSSLFVVQPPKVQGPGLLVFPLPIGERELREAVHEFRGLLQSRDADVSQLTLRASGLYALLIGPADAQIDAAKRVLISAHGPLYTLPFAALVRKGRYLVEWKPFHSILSATVYAELKKARRTIADPAQNRLVAFGDPIYPPLLEKRETAPAATLEILAAVRSGLSLDPIPGTRSEVERIGSLYPGAQIYLGANATEERVKSVASEARLLHFAAHGFLNERFPLDSALALTIPEHPEKGQENGLLHAWEILESVRLDADLVTLSACDTALGKEMGGEGLIGLTRAFQYAGARSVLASLWSVSDASTADLMKRFYGYLREGRSKDEALRAAQVDMIDSQDFSHPYYWAAFQLTGDWR